MGHRWVIVLLPLFLALGGCAAIAVVDATVGVVATTAKVTVKAAGAAATAIIPDDKKNEKQSLI